MRESLEGQDYSRLVQVILGQLGIWIQGSFEASLLIRGNHVRGLESIRFGLHGLDKSGVDRDTIQSLALKSRCTFRMALKSLAIGPNL
jgi:hypothetical protein